MFIQTAFYTRSVRTSCYIVEDVRISCSVWSAVAATVPLGETVPQLEEFYDIKLERFQSFEIYTT